MNKPITVKRLLEVCKEQIKNGNGDKIIMISDDDEGNGYHYMWYEFSQAKNLIDEDAIDTRIASIDNTIILG